ncbi:hypothetical protein Pyn_00774 [Prunus yedoensis var. nudiflora]|uniref:Uncharacterized protein n=1 Tax=Prunus yedoensis var. nudiflora TaxID=2094558 RepID=A0A314U672_PRUYE|nr:hypothetical protein Pyn_00774 [Prunus yedoensis var. nudiflora]
MGKGVVMGLGVRCEREATTVGRGYGLLMGLGKKYGHLLKLFGEAFKNKLDVDEDVDFALFCGLGGKFRRRGAI